MTGFEDKSLTAIKAEVISELMPDLKFDAEDEAYVGMRYKICVEDADKDTPMGRELKKHLKTTVEDAKPVISKVDEARQKAIARNA